MTYPYRCTRGNCRKYVTLKKKKEWYIREPKCPVCKGNLNHRPWYRKHDKERTCKCDGIHYPHRKGTEPWCDHAKVGPTDEDWEERYRYSDVI